MGARSHSSIDSRNSFSERVLIEVGFTRSIDSSNRGSSSSRSCALRSKCSTSSDLGGSGTNMNSKQRSCATGRLVGDEGVGHVPEASPKRLRERDFEHACLNLDFSNQGRVLKAFRPHGFTEISCWQNHDQHTRQGHSKESAHSLKSKQRWKGACR